MLAMTSNNGKMVRICAEHFFDTGTVEYTVYCAGTTFKFGEFAPAARTYNQLSKYIYEGLDCTNLLKNLVKGARVMGYTVKEVA